MSLLPLNQKKSENPFYGSYDSQTKEEETLLLVGMPGKARHVEFEVAEIIYELFNVKLSGESLDQHPKSNPKKCPEKRFARHRNFYIWKLNQFRHWWKTSRLLVRTSGAYEFCLNQVNWLSMATYHLKKHRQAKTALKTVKAIGRGGPSKDFLNNVKPFTRTIRIVLAVARGWEARVDNRLYEVSIAEAFAFMGNRCSRWVARQLVEVASATVAFPLSVKFVEPYLDQRSRPVIIAMGFLRSVLPFMFSFTGSAIGRQLTFNTYKFANFRWRPVQSVMKFNKTAGNYQDTELDPELEDLAHVIAVAIGHGKDPIETRQNMDGLGFQVVGCGQGGYAVYRRYDRENRKAILVHITPYGPSILDEMPRYILLERKKLYSSRRVDWDQSDAMFLDAAIYPEAAIFGFTYSGAFFKSQEWAALKSRFDETLEAYDEACKKLGTPKSMNSKNAVRVPPTDLLTLKEFIRSGHIPKKKRKDAKRWKEIDSQVRKLSKLCKVYQKSGKAPKKVILYLEGLDCTAKSSTGGLICATLEDCGYAVRTAQHNRPPTAEQRAKPWMDRIRFEYPEDVYAHGEEIPEYTALVWDRGPAGDFVYGKLDELDFGQKVDKHNEFKAFDARCREDGVLFIKLLFVADKDSIASTLGKRLAHKKIARDLRTWLDANSIAHMREGLEEIEAHIDPTDFVAFNQYKRNLSIFTYFARNTDSPGRIGGDGPGSDSFLNPWTVVNTCKRHPARLGLLRVFERHLRSFAGESRTCSPGQKLKALIGLKPKQDARTASTVPKDFVEEQERGLSFRAILQSIVLFFLLYFYAYITWKFDIQEYA